MRTILLLQAVLIAAVTLVFFGKSGPGGAQAALFGGAIALLDALFLGWRVQRASRVAGRSAARAMVALYVGAAERFVFTLVGFGLGLGLLHLQPLPLLLAFVAAQAGYWVGARRAANSAD